MIFTFVTVLCSPQKKRDLLELEITGWVGPTKKDMGLGGINEHNTQSALFISPSQVFVFLLTIFLI